MPQQKASQYPPLPRSMTAQEAAQYLALSKSFLDHARLNGNGPRFFRVGGRVRYRREDLDAWIDSFERYSSVAEEAAEAATTAKPARKRRRRAA